MLEIIKLLQSDLEAEGMHFQLTMTRRNFKFYDPEYSILSGLLELIERSEAKKRVETAA